MAEQTIVSADSHIIEPADLWTSRMPRHLRERAPRVVRQDFHGRESDLFVAEGLVPFPVSGFAVAGFDPREFPDRMTRGYAGVRPSAWDPALRIADQERDGVAGEVLYPSLAMTLFQLEDAELRAASFAAYNEWLADYCAHSPRRLAGIAMISLEDPRQATADLAAAAIKGLRGAMVWGDAPAERPYGDPSYVFWAAAQALGLPLSFHILTERRSSNWKTTVMRYYPLLHHVIQRTFSELILSGVLERFPRLQIVSVENDIGWIAHFIQRLDHAWEKYRYLEPTGAIPNPPGFYFRRQIRATFQDDLIGVRTRDAIGADNLMWASDFPHSDSTWPHSREVIERDFAGVPAAELRKMVFETASQLYRLG
jgi:predicted TIM-barrel fold metal-dependent hydrolase